VDAEGISEVMVLFQKPRPVHKRVQDLPGLLESSSHHGLPGYQQDIQAWQDIP
jgi:hypothetical protein